MAPSALIVDLDGTIWDSFPWYSRILAAATGQSSAYFEERLQTGNSILSLLKAHRISRRRFENEMKGHFKSLRFYDGVFETLSQFQKRLVPVAAVTNLPLSFASSIASGTCVDKYITTIISPSLRIRSKPSPTGVRAALNSLQREAGPDTWFVGDRVEDAEAASAANVLFIWASYGYQAKMPEGTTIAIDSFSELWNLCN